MFSIEVAAIAGGSPRPRVTFTEFQSEEDPMFASWVRFRSPLPGTSKVNQLDSLLRPHPGRVAGGPGRHAAPTRSASGFWRLLASNNRELGRSYLLYRSFEDACAHVRELQSDIGALAIALVSGPRRGSRGWIITHGNEVVLTCSRWYESTSTRSTAAAGALAALPNAILADAPDRSGPSGRVLRRPLSHRALDAS